jgi:hypothetical protein
MWHNTYPCQPEEGVMAFTLYGHSLSHSPTSRTSYSQPDILWPPVLWGLVFTIINLYPILRIYLERRLTGESFPVDATFTETARYMRWPLYNIHGSLDKRPELHVTLQSLVNRDLGGKLQGLLSR